MGPWDLNLGVGVGVMGVECLASAGATDLARDNPSRLLGGPLQGEAAQPTTRDVRRGSEHPWGTPSPGCCPPAGEGLRSLKLFPRSHGLVSDPKHWD